jgi:hypothetical protein
MEKTRDFGQSYPQESERNRSLSYQASCGRIMEEKATVSFFGAIGSTQLQ